MRWVVAQRDLDLGDWRARIAGPGAGGWIGSGPSSESAAGNLYRYDGEVWRLAQTFSLPGARTYVLDVDPAGRLWVAPYARDAGRTYERLEVSHLRDGVWHTEVLVPGLWPQAMAWPSAGEGWIAGNNGLLYHRSRGRWRLETLDLPAALRENLNFQALRMAGPRSGWAVGSGGLVARYDGRRWSRQPVPPLLEGRQLWALDLAEDGTLWVAGAHGTLASRDGASGRWRVWPTGVDTDLLGIDRVGRDDGWAVGGGGVILRFDGTGWKRQPSPTREALTDVRMGGAGEGWIAAGPLVLRAVTGSAPRFWDRSGDFPALAGRGADQLAALDAEDDGDLDLFTVDREAIRLYENGGGGSLSGRSRALRPPAGDLAPEGAAWGDADGDGRLDILAVGRPPKAVWHFRQSRPLGFTPAAPLPVGPPGGLRDLVSLLDLNGDGRLDLHLARSTALAEGRLPDRIYSGDGAGHWRPLAGATGDRGVEEMALWGDVDGDLDLDLILAAFGRELDLWRNDGGRLRRATRGSGLDFPFPPGEIEQGALWDLDRDGDLDLLLLGNRLDAFRNDGRGRFRPAPDWIEPLASRPVLAPGQVAAGDLDLDGWPEILFTPTAGSSARVVLLRRGADGRYRDVAAEAGVRDLAGRAALFADWDGDGDLDLLAAGAKRSYLLENRRIEPGSPGPRPFLKVRVRGPLGDRLSRGAQVRVYTAGRLGEPAALAGFQSAGTGLPASGVSHSSELVFGVRPGGRFDLEVRFPNGRRSVRAGVAAGSTVTVHDRPWGARQAATALARAERAARLAVPWQEALLLAAALAPAFALRSPWGRRLGRGSLGRHPAVPFALGALQLGAAVLAVDRPPGLPRAVSLAAPGTAALALLAAERGWSAWSAYRRARHLGPYRLLELIGEGGMGAVWRARHLVTRREVALKVLQPHRTAEEAHRTRFLREGAILARLDHPNIVRVHETGEIGGRGFISMERLSGSTLGALLRREGPLPPSEAAAFLAVAAGALAEVHRSGIVHRDVKSENFFVTGDGSGLPRTLDEWRARLRLMDFGLAHLRDLATLTAADGLLGTLAYLAPEQLAGQPHDLRSDLYSLGVVAFEAAAGALPPSPFRSGSPEADLQAELDRGLERLPEPLAELLARLLDRDPEHRPAGAMEIVEAAEACLRDGRPAGAGSRPPGAPAEVGPGPTDTADTTERLWQVRLAEIRRSLDCGRVAEAQVQLLALIAELRRRLEGLDPEERNLYARRCCLGEVLDLERQVRLGFQEIP